MILACPRDTWQCDYGQCIPKEKRCNGNIDCPDDISDERNCSSKFIYSLKCKLREKKTLHRQKKVIYYTVDTYI